MDQRNYLELGGPSPAGADAAAPSRSDLPRKAPGSSGGASQRSRRAGLRWTIVLAFYNEKDEIVETLRQLLRQTRPFRLVLVDNGSTDNSVALCHSVLDGSSIDYVVLEEKTPGQVAAIETGLAAVDTEFVATCDADTFYPASYLANAEAIFDSSPDGVVAVSAHFIAHEGGQGRAAIAAMHQLMAAWLLSWQTHVGGAGHSFRTETLRAAGGYSWRRWPYLLADHEVMHRVMKYGRQRLASYHWCSPSERRGEPMRWSLLERIGYHLTPFGLKDRYFRWLAERFRRRGMLSGRLRVRDWEKLST